MSKPPKLNFRALIEKDVAPNKEIGQDASQPLQDLPAPAAAPAPPPSAARAPEEPPANSAPALEAAARPSEADPTPNPAPRRAVVPLRQRPAAKPDAPEKGRGTIRDRARQLSLYLEDPVYDQIREIAHVERVKMHQLILEGVDLVLRKRGSPSIKELMKKTG